jgi:hypothetical protein
MYYFHWHSPQLQNLGRTTLTSASAILAPAKDVTKQLPHFKRNKRSPSHRHDIFPFYLILWLSVALVARLSATCPLLSWPLQTWTPAMHTSNAVQVGHILSVARASAKKLTLGVQLFYFFLSVLDKTHLRCEHCDKICFSYLHSHVAISMHCPPNAHELNCSRSRIISRTSILSRRFLLAFR